jgi:hypothetical protein
MYVNISASFKKRAFNIPANKALDIVQSKVFNHPKDLLPDFLIFTFGVLSDMQDL